MKFRNDVNGLRAIAVISVIFFHYKVPAMTGGFVGVDVFFVISGYLMTKIILSRLDDERFSLTGFYVDRARRIVPALAGLVAMLLAVGYFLVAPGVYRQIGMHSLAALSFVSNIVFYKEAGYFDLESEQKWLLHTWSLSAEWQFYLIYPILLLTLQRSGLSKWRRHVLLIGLLLSLALCIAGTANFRQACFFLLPARAWEMLAGGLVYVYANPGRRSALQARIMEASGLALVLASLFMFDSATPWPSYWAVAPVIGTCLVIAAERRDAIWASNRVVGLIGRWSYAAYIWHWPIAVGFAYFEFGRSPIAMGVVLIGALAFGGAGMRALAGFQQGHALLADGKVRQRLGFAAITATAIAAGAVFADQGLPWRHPESRALVELYESAKADWDFPKNCEGLSHTGQLRPCVAGPTTKGGTLFIGDSHAEMLFPRFVARDFANYESGVTFATARGCPPAPGVNRLASGYHCDAFFEKAMEFAETGHFGRVVLISTWAYFVPPGISVTDTDRICFTGPDGCRLEIDAVRYQRKSEAVFSQLTARLRALRDRGIDVIVVLPFPRLSYDLTMNLAKRAFLGSGLPLAAPMDRVAFEAETGDIRTILKAVALRADARTLDPDSYLCSATICPTLDQAGAPLYVDSNHFRASAVRDSRFGFVDALLNRNTEWVDVAPTN
ncbi:acyltransferase family protein [Methylocella silvestris]|uniref:Acyltransferase n=1 Tax=Methylocella silvestris TaxID=199596 RepID=A0A2J7TDA7_METSI|nr:acyltransferase family protein [Methylocella silvestris]PNG24748.1 hypothetical protein CR492_17260 [Methylocella silvestris]